MDGCAGSHPARGESDQTRTAGKRGGEPVSALELTLGAVAAHGWRVVLLQSRTKKPTGHHWVITMDRDRIRHHVGNLGLVCGPVSGVAVLDPDVPEAFDALERELGPLVRT